MSRRSRQKHKGMKRPRSWHRRYAGPDWAFLTATKKLDRAIQRSQREEDSP